MQTFDFGEALRLLKAGRRVTRVGWNGKGMFVYYVPANSYPAMTPVARMVFGETVPYRAYLAMKTAQGDVVTWTISVSDALEDDWTEVED